MLGPSHTAVHKRFNAASVLAGGRVLGSYFKRELPNYQVFDERRYFVSGRDAGFAPVVFEAGGHRIGLLITWWAARTRWCSTAPRLPSTRQGRGARTRAGLRSPAS
jgi:hypothetical protein